MFMFKTAEEVSYYYEMVASEKEANWRTEHARQEAEAALRDRLKAMPKVDPSRVNAISKANKPQVRPPAGPVLASGVEGTAHASPTGTVRKLYDPSKTPSGSPSPALNKATARTSHGPAKKPLTTALAKIESKAPKAMGGWKGLNLAGKGAVIGGGALATAAAAYGGHKLYRHFRPKQQKTGSPIRLQDRGLRQ